MNRVTYFLGLLVFVLSGYAQADVRFVVGQTSEQSRESVHTYLIETDSLVPSQWVSVLSHTCCIVSQIQGTNKVLITASPDLLEQFRKDIEILERIAQSGGDVTAEARRLSSFYSGSQAIVITPQKSVSTTFQVTDSRVDVMVAIAVLAHFPQANMTMAEGGLEIAAMEVNERQIRQLLAAAVK